jgi:hypothetical protein
MIRILLCATQDGHLGKVKQYLVDTRTGYAIGQVFINLANSKFNGPAYDKPQYTCVSSPDHINILKNFRSFGYNLPDGSVSHDHLDNSPMFVQGAVDNEQIAISVCDTEGKKINTFGTTGYVSVIDSNHAAIGQQYILEHLPNGTTRYVGAVTTPTPNIIHT